MRDARQHPVLIGLIALGMALTAGLVLRGAALVIAWEEHAPVEGWMTPRYVQLAFDLPGGVLSGILGVPEGAVPREPLSRIAADQGRDGAALVAEVEAAVRAQREEGQ